MRMLFYFLISLLYFFPNSAVFYKISDYPSGAYELQLTDSLAFITRVNISILDISDPYYPQQINIIDIPEAFFDSVIIDSLLYAVGESGLFIYNVSDPYNIQLIGTLDTTDDYGEYIKILVSGNIVFINESNYNAFPKIRIIDASDPCNPNLISSLITSASIECIYGDVLVTSSGCCTLNFIDLSNLSNPQLINSFDIPIDFGRIRDIVIKDESAFVITDSSIIILDINNIVSPQILSTYSLSQYSSAYEITLMNDTAFIACGNIGLIALDISDFYNISVINSYQVRNFCTHVAVKDDIAIICDSDHVFATPAILHIIDISDAANSQLIFSDNNSELSISLSISDNNAYVYGRYTGLSIYDISEPYTTTLEATFNITEYYQESNLLSVCNGNAFIVSGDSLLHIIDITNPENPQLSFTHVIPNDFKSIAVKDNLLYMVFEHSVKIYDISDPQYVEELSSYYEDIDFKYVLRVSDSKLFISYGMNGIKIIDVSDPLNPQSLCSYQAQISATDIDIYNNRIFMSGCENGIEVIDISDPTSPNHLETILLHNSSLISKSYINSESGLLFVIDNCWDEINVFDIANTQSIELLNRYSWNNITTDIAYKEGKIYTTNWHSGFNILDFEVVSLEDSDSAISSYCRIQNYPNPFNPNTIISFALQEKSEASIRIYNLKGQLVKDFGVDVYDKGMHKLIWNGRDSYNQASASGIYFIQMTVGEQKFTRKIMMLK